MTLYDLDAGGLAPNPLLVAAGGASPFLPPAAVPATAGMAALTSPTRRFMSCIALRNSCFLFSRNWIASFILSVSGCGGAAFAAPAPLALPPLLLLLLLAPGCCCRSGPS